MKRVVSCLAMLIVFVCFFLGLPLKKGLGIAPAQASETIIFEYKDHGIKNSFYINESSRLSDEELESLMPVVQNVWDNMVNALEEKDIETAIIYFSPSVRKGFKMFLSVAIEHQFDKMVPMLKSYSFSPNQGTSKFIQCYSELSGGVEAPEVVFEKVGGEWKIGFI